MKQRTKTIRFTGFLLAATILFSCSSDDDSPTPDPEPELSCHIVQYEVGGATTSIDYNSEGNIRSVSHPDGSTTTFVYSGNTIIKNEAGTTTTISLNPDGLVVNSRSEDDSDPNLWENTAFEYNGRQVIKKTSTDSNGNEYEGFYEWNDGNVVAYTEGTLVQTFEYYPGQDIQDGDYLQFTFTMLYGTSLLKSANLLKSIESGGDIANFDYEFDDDDKITSVTATGSSFGGTMTGNYTYACN